jgi:hypothetical protein
MLPDWTQSLAYLGITAAVAGMVALPRTGKPRAKMPESSRTGSASIRRPSMRRNGPRAGWDRGEHSKRIGDRAKAGKRQTGQNPTSS